jgi:hypothetical protein
MIKENYRLKSFFKSDFLANVSRAIKPSRIRWASLVEGIVDKIKFSWKISIQEKP